MGRLVDGVRERWGDEGRVGGLKENKKAPNMGTQPMAHF